MNVLQLIERLQLISDKTMPVCIAHYDISVVHDVECINISTDPATPNVVALLTAHLKDLS